VNEPSAPSPETAATAIYVYGVVPAETSAALFADVRGVDASEATTLITHGGLAAVAGRVRLDEFGEEALAANLRSAEWLEANVRAHDEVLAAAVGRATVVPFRFGAVYESEDHVRTMLAERRDVTEALNRLAGAIELGVNAYLDEERFRARFAAERGVASEEAESGRAYMQRRQLERELDSAVGSFAAEIAQQAHERLAASAQDARVNPVRPAVSGGRGEMVLNGAYLVSTGHEDTFRAAVTELGSRYADDGVAFELTGPWPPYNFAETDAS
jgi:gas vesicle protein GvpL/GvpF